MRKTPLLVLAYNRPEKMRRLLDNLSAIRPATVMVVVDGPRPGDECDRAKVLAVQELVQTIDWTNDVETLFRPANVGLRASVADAVTWAIARYGETMVIEDDALPGRDYLPYSIAMLERFRNDDHVAHISGYNLVPPSVLRAGVGSRLTIYPESFAWATWERAWRGYDPTMEWARNVSINDLAKITGTLAGAARWKQNFTDAAAERISTWAYRWIASMWSRGAVTLSPNRNLVTYIGYDEGTHTTLDAPWDELPVYDGASSTLLEGTPVLDAAAERWVARTVFRETPYGVARGVAISGALEARKAWRRLKA
jgi:hypothetical protein